MRIRASEWDERLLYAIMAVQLAFVLALAFVSAQPIPFAYGRPMLAATSIWAVGLAFLLTAAGLKALRADRPVAAFVSNLLASRPVIFRAFRLSLVLGLTIAAHGWAKTMIPHITGFWADPMLANLDAAIFGQDPWTIFRSESLAEVYVLVYLSWFPITFGTLGLLAFSRRDQSRPIAAYLVTLVFGGTIGQYVLPSAGPIFYERIGLGQRFSELVATNSPNFNNVADYLWVHYQSGGADIGTGISAMPSLHVALAAWTVIGAYNIWRPLVVPAAVYAALIWAASIASGWHYMTDGLAGVLAAAAAYAVTQLTGRKTAMSSRPAEIGRESQASITV